VDTQEQVGSGGGGTAWGGTTEADFAAGRHTYTASTNDWGGWDTPLTEDAAVLFTLVCEERFTFEGVHRPAALHLFSHHDLQRGAGIEATLFSGASGGVALDEELANPRRFRFEAIGLQGAGALVVSHADGRDRHVFGPEGIEIVGGVPEEPLTVAASRAGAATVFAGAVHHGMQPFEPASVLS
jgi:hypothetical protein